MPNSHDKCGFCKGETIPTIVACELCIVRKIVGICTDCQQPFERLEPRNHKEVRCVPCQIEYRKTEGDKQHAWERYKAQLEADQ